MSNEEIIKEIDEATRLMAEAKVKMNGALNLARGAIMKGNTVDTEAYNKGLKDGRNEAWELAKKIIVDFRNKTGDEFLDIFGCYCTEVFVTHTPQEALAKLEAYEKEQATFKRGNIVLFVDTDELAIYIGQYADGTHAVVFNDCNIPQKVSTEEIRKTDKNIDIQSVLL